MTVAERLRSTATRVVPSDREALRAAAPWALSLSLHGLLVVGALFVAWRVIEPEQAPPATAVSFESPAYDPALVIDAQAPAERSAPAPVREFAAALAPATPGTPDPAAVFAPPADPAGALALPAQGPNLSINLPKSLGARFAGVNASDARDIVYVVDGSGSMVTSLPDVLSELKRSIRALHPTQRFQVIVFRVVEAGGVERTFETPGRLALLPATADNKARAESWLDSLRARGRSDPTGALRAALELKPAAVFLLSSRLSAGAGGPDVDELLSYLDRANPVDRRSGRRRVLIRTIQVLDPEPDEALLRIAQAHGGANGYKFISPEELERSGPGSAPAPRR